MQIRGPGRGHGAQAAVSAPPLGTPSGLIFHQATLRGTGRQTNPILIEEEETMVSLLGAYREGLTGGGKMQIGRSLQWGKWQKKEGKLHHWGVQGCLVGSPPSLLRLSLLYFILTYFLAKKATGKGEKVKEKKK